MTAPDEGATVRPHRPESAVRRFGLRSGVSKPTSSDVHWLLVDLEQPGGAGRVTTARIALAVLLVPGLVLYTASTADSAPLGLVAGGVAVVLATTVTWLRLRGGRARRALYGTSSVDDTGRVVLDSKKIDRQTRSVRFGVGLMAVYAVIGALGLAADPPRAPEADAACRQTGDGVEVTATVTNPSDDQINVNLEIDIETDEGDRYTSNARSASVEADGRAEVVVQTDARGEPVACDARVVGFVRFDLGP